MQLFFSATNELEAFMLKAASQELVDALVKNEPGPAAEDALFGLFAEYVVHNYSAELQAYRCNLLKSPSCVLASLLTCLTHNVLLVSLHLSLCFPSVAAMINNDSAMLHLFPLAHGWHYITGTFCSLKASPLLPDPDLV